MSEIKKIIKKTPIIYPLWHRMRVGFNERKEKKKIEAYQKYSKEILEDIFKVAINNNFPLISAYGTLLGIVRDNMLLPWDDDLDFIILDDGTFSWNYFDECMKKKGFWLYREIFQDNKIAEKSYKKKGVLCDVRIWDNYSENRTVYGDYFAIEGYSYKSGVFEEYDMTVQEMIPIYDIIKKQFNKFEIMIPANSEAVLEAFYGVNWRSPEPNYVPSGKKFRIKRKVTYYNKPLFCK